MRRHRSHSIKTAAVAYRISDDIIPAALIHLNLEQKVKVSVFPRNFIILEIILWDQDG